MANLSMHQVHPQEDSSEEDEMKKTPSRKKEEFMELQAKTAMDVWNLVQLKGISSTNRQTLYCRINRYLKRMTRRKEK